jgi:hypothetical protein
MPDDRWSESHRRAHYEAVSLLAQGRCRLSDYRLRLGPRDFEGLGREKFWDQSPEERAKALPVMVEDANINCAARVDVRYLGVVSENKAFAKGWLNELQRVGAYNKRDRKK